MISIDNGLNENIYIWRNAPNHYSKLEEPNLEYEHVLKVNNFNLNVSNDNSVQNLFGEADNRFYKRGDIQITSSCDFPVMLESHGGLDYTFLTLWGLLKNSIYGTESIINSRIDSVGQNELFLTNIEEFLDLPVPYSILVDGYFYTVTAMNSESVVINTPYLGNINAIVYKLDENLIEKSIDYSYFNLLSTKEGNFFPTLIKDFSLNIGLQEVDAKLNFMSTNLDRDIRPYLRNLNIPSKPSPKIHYNGFDTQIGIVNLTDAGDFIGLAEFIDFAFLGAFSGLDFFKIVEVDLNIDNNLSYIKGSHSLERDAVKRKNANMFPYGIFSSGRKVTGKLKYISELDSYFVAERINGIYNGGINIHMGINHINLNNLIWTPSTTTIQAEQNIVREVNFEYITKERNGLPEIK